MSGGGRHRTAFGALALVLFGILLALALAEPVLRWRAGVTPYRVLPANVRAEFHPAPGVMPGIRGVSVYSTNAEGIRGRPFAEIGSLNLLAVGGSTTECLYLDDAEAWPALLERALQRRLGRPVWVGNVGASGVGAAEHVQVARHYLPQLRLDAALVMAGVNDLAPVLRKGDAYRPDSEDPDDYDYFLDRSFHRRPLVDPDVERPFPSNLAVWNLAVRGVAALRAWSKAKLGDGDLRVEDRAGAVYEERRAILHPLPVLDGLPDLGPALARYGSNLRELVARIQDTGAHAILLTQPSVWHADLSPEMERLLWMAFLGDNESPEGRYAPSDLATAMNAFNQVLLEVCRQTGSDCVDLATLMADAQRESYYYDDVHFNERGAQRVAEVVAGGIAPLLEGAERPAGRGR